MPLEQRINRVTGQPYWIDTETGETQNPVSELGAPSNAPAVPETITAFGAEPSQPSASQAPRPAAPTPSIPIAGGPNFLPAPGGTSFALQPNVLAQALTPRPPAAQPRPDENIGAATGEHIGGFPRGIAESGPTPEFQQYSDTIGNLIGQIGNPSVPAVPQLPNAPTATVNPAFQYMADAAERQNQTGQQMLGEMRQLLERNNPNARSKWVRFGEYLSAVAADGDLANAGVIMTEQLRNDREMAEEYARETMGLTMQGMSFEAAQQQAMANLLSGQHATSETNVERAYERDVGQTELQSRYDLAAVDAQNRATQSAATLAAGLAENTYGEATAQRERRSGALAGLANVPGWENEASLELGADAFPGDRRAGTALATGLARQNRLARIAARNSTGRSASNMRDLSVTLRRQYPDLTEEDIQEIAMMMAQGAQ